MVYLRAYVIMSEFIITRDHCIHCHIVLFVAEHLLRLLEALGTLSITSTELTQFIQLLKADAQGTQVQMK